MKEKRRKRKKKKREREKKTGRKPFAPCDVILARLSLKRPGRVLLAFLYGVAYPLQNLKLSL